MYNCSFAVMRIFIMSSFLIEAQYLEIFVLYTKHPFPSFCLFVFAGSNLFHIDMSLLRGQCHVKTLEMGFVLEILPK